MSLYPYTDNPNDCTSDELHAEPDSRCPVCEQPLVWVDAKNCGNPACTNQYVHDRCLSLACESCGSDNPFCLDCAANLVDQGDFHLCAQHAEVTV